MKTLRAEQAGELIERYLGAFWEYQEAPAGRVRRLREPVLQEAVRSMGKLQGSEGVRELLRGAGSAEQTEELYQKITALLRVFGISGVPEGMEGIRIGNGERGVLERIAGTARKFGDSRIGERLDAWEAGEAAIVFREMAEGTEGYTAVEGEKNVYALNKRYEEAADEAALQKAGIVLAHELRRNPGSGALARETEEIVRKDVEYIERLAGEYGERVYYDNPEFGVLHYVKELFGENGLSEFTGKAFSHEGSYWKLNRNGDLEDDGKGRVLDVQGNTVYETAKGRQAGLEEWLGLKGISYDAVLKPAGYTHTVKKNETGQDVFDRWINTPGIKREILEQAYSKGKITKNNYEKYLRACEILNGPLAGVLEAAEKKNPVFAETARKALNWLIGQGGILGETWEEVVRLSEEAWEDVVRLSKKTVRLLSEKVQQGVDALADWFLPPIRPQAADQEVINNYVSVPEPVPAVPPIHADNAEFEIDTGSVIQSNERIDQNQLRPEEPNGPCLFRALLAAAEEMTGKNLTLNQLHGIAASLKESNAIGNTDEYYFVNNSAAVVKEGLRILGYPDASVIVGVDSSKPSGDADFTIRYIGSKYHFQLGDSKGGLLWEPYKYDIPSNAFTGEASSFRDITIKLQGK